MPKIRENCPSFLIAIAGASIAILGAIWTDKIIVHELESDTTSTYVFFVLFVN